MKKLTDKELRAFMPEHIFEKNEKEGLKIKNSTIVIKYAKPDSLTVKSNFKQQMAWEIKVYSDFTTPEGREYVIKKIEEIIEKTKLRLFK